MSISILSKTSSQYAEEVHCCFGKGREQARYLYQEWFRTGKNTGIHPAFNNAKQLLKDLQEQTSWDILTPKTESNDGLTQKILLLTEEGYEIESVIIPMEAGGTLCISSQIGCQMGCRFCETGRMGLLKNLSVEEIVGQVFYVRHHLKSSFRNIVFMGMGEPFDNYENVLQAFHVLNDPNGLNFGARNITFSTSGKIEEIRRLADLPIATPNLAVSLNASNDKLRTFLMPINRNQNMAELKEALLYYSEKKQKQVLIAYVLLKGVNDTAEHAHELAQYLSGLDIKVNLIPYNAQSCERFSPPEPQSLQNFKTILQQNKLQVLVRKTQGDRIMAACGQLGNVAFRKRISTFAAERANKL